LKNILKLGDFLTNTIKHKKEKNYAGRRKGRSSKKDKAKSKSEREWQY